MARSDLWDALVRCFGPIALFMGLALPLAGCPLASVDEEKSFSAQRVDAASSAHGLSPLTEAGYLGVPSGSVAPGTTDLIRVRGFTTAARSRLLDGSGNPKYVVCDQDAASTAACTVNGVPPSDTWAGISFDSDLTMTEAPASGSGLWHASLPFRVDASATTQRVVPIDIVDNGGAGAGTRYTRDYRIPVASASQVFNKLNASASAIDLAEQDVAVGAIAFLPPNYQFAYAAVRGGGYAVIDTDTDTSQQSAQTDLIITSFANNWIYFYQGITEGAAQFFPRGFQALYQKPDSIATGDFDQDGDLDLAVADNGSTKVSVLLGNGAAGTVSFQAASHVEVGSSPNAVATADLDHDGNVDVATLMGTDTAQDCSVKLLEGVGNGTFGVSITASGGSGSTEQPTAIATGRLRQRRQAGRRVHEARPHEPLRRQLGVPP